MSIAATHNPMDKSEVKQYLRENYLDTKKSLVKFDLANPIYYAFIKSSVNDSEKMNMRQLLWHFMEDKYDSVKCKVLDCNNDVRWDKDKQGYREFCSSNCANNSESKKNKIKETIFQNYGEGIGYSNSIIRKRIETTNEKRYNAKSPFASKEIRETINKNFIERYGSHPLKSENVRSKLSRSRSKFCHGNNYHDISSTLYNKDWLYTQHHDLQKTCLEISNELGVHVSTVCRHMHNFNIPILNMYQSLPEKELIDFLTHNGFLLEIRTKKLIPPYEIDILIPTHNLAIEFCGLYWHNEINKPNKNYHFEKYKKCKSKGIRLLTIFEDEWNHNKDLVLDKILFILHRNKKNTIYARKTFIDTVSSNDKKIFLEHNHIQGNGHSSINYGLYHTDELVAVITFLQRKNEFELTRFATSKQVVGGFSKLMSHFTKNHIGDIITFADLRWSEGDLYYKNGFQYDKFLNPDYHYIVNNRRYHKFNFRKKLIKKKLKFFDDSLTEHENMVKNNIFRIYDCGKIRFRFSN